jgi:PilZ domain-containing protein
MLYKYIPDAEAAMDRKFAGNGITPIGAEQPFWLSRALEASQEQQQSEKGFNAEPRHSIRRPVNLDVVVNHGMTFSVPSQVRNLSLTGAFVEMDAAHLPVGAFVEIVLRYHYDGKAIVHRLPATVARIEERGIGLSFDRYDDDTYTDLSNLLCLL